MSRGDRGPPIYEYNTCMSAPLLSEHNSLSRLDNGVWVKADAAERSFIDYTDGDSAENSVFAHVQSAQDRSVYSPELDLPWEDWALEYHLGSRRSNIYRGLNLEGVRNVLEVGCGCGAITRYLGEQGFRVDAIEGSLRRAGIARLRTEGLDKVEIVSSNYHEMALPADTYDLVVFTGVLEYSGAYTTETIEPEQQLRQTLEQARLALNETGRILIAIENRLGFKYLAGAGEDHLNVPHIGLLGYPEPLSQPLTRGIRTWSRSEWTQMLQAFGFPAFEFCYPFPDYKVPEAIVSEHFLGSTRNPDQVLGGIHSRDYATTWWPSVSESLFWKTAAQAHSLQEYANSFLIVVAKSGQQDLGRTIDFDFVRFASSRRMMAFRMQVAKKRDKSTVQRLLLKPEEQRPEDVVRQVLIENEPYVDGQVLEAVWAQALKVMPSYEELAVHIRRYGEWLQNLVASGTQSYVDAVPRNIIVDDEGAWHVIDQEWYALEEVPIEVIFFRAMFHYVLDARDALADMELNAARRAVGLVNALESLPLIETLDDFVAWGFAQMGMDYPAHRERCLDFERRLAQQLTVAGSPDLERMLSTPIYQWHAGQSFEQESTPLEVRAFWTQLDGVWHLDHSVAITTTFEHGLNVTLELPPSVTTHRYVRIDPAADVLQVFRGWLEFRGLSVLVVKPSGETRRVYFIDSADEFYNQARLHGIQLIRGERFMLTSSNASIVLDLKGVEWGDEVESVRLSLVMDLSSDKSLITARRILREESTRAAYRVRLRQYILDQQGQRLEANERRLAELRERLHRRSTTRIGRILARFGLMRKIDL